MMVETNNLETVFGPITFRSLDQQSTFGAFVGSTDEQKRRRRSEHEARRVAHQPWDDADGRSNR